MEGVLRTADLTNLEPVYWGSNSVYTADLRLNGSVVGRAVYKPQRGEAPLWDFPDGTLYKREYAAYLVSRSLGWPFIPTTVVRDGPHGVGTVQHFVTHDQRKSVDQIRKASPETIDRIILFDAITNNADRKTDHVIVGHDGRVYGIDHGLCFHCESKQRTVFIETSGTAINPRVLKQLNTWRANPGNANRLRRQLSEWLDGQEVSTFFTRLNRIADKGVLPEVRPRWYGYF